MSHEESSGSSMLEKEVAALRTENATLREENAALRAESATLRKENERLQRCTQADKAVFGPLDRWVQRSRGPRFMTVEEIEDDGDVQTWVVTKPGPYGE